jgi:hypothetical protein
MPTAGKIVSLRRPVWAGATPKFAASDVEFVIADNGDGLEGSAASVERACSINGDYTLSAQQLVEVVLVLDRVITAMQFSDNDCWGSRSGAEQARQRVGAASTTVPTFYVPLRSPDYNRLIGSVVDHVVHSHTPTAIRQSMFAEFERGMPIRSPVTGMVGDLFEHGGLRWVSVQPPVGYNVEIPFTLSATLMVAAGDRVQAGANIGFDVTGWVSRGGVKELATANPKRLAAVVRAWILRQCVIRSGHTLVPHRLVMESAATKTDTTQAAVAFGGDSQFIDSVQGFVGPVPKLPEDGALKFYWAGVAYDLTPALDIDVPPVDVHNRASVWGCGDNVEAAMVEFYAARAAELVRMRQRSAVRE